MSDKRTRLKPVYMTDTERDLVRHAMDVLTEQLATIMGSGGRDRFEKFAASHTAKRIAATRALFDDKAPK